MTIGRRIAKNFLSLAIADVASRGLNFGVMVYLARVLEPSTFGALSFALAFVSVFHIFANAGLDLFGIREVAAQPHERTKIISNIFTMKLCLSMVVFVVYLVIISVIPKDALTRQLLTIYGFLILSTSLLFEWVFQGVERMEFTALARCAGDILYCGLVIITVQSASQVVFVPGIRVATHFLNAGVLFFLYRRFFTMFRLRFDWGYWKEMLRKALPIGMSGFMSLIICYIDTIILGFMRPPEDVGFYTSAYKIMMIFLFLSAAYYNAIFPAIAFAYRHSIVEFSRLLESTGRLTVIFSLPIAIAGVMLAGPAILLFYGPHYSPAIAPLKILFLVIALNYLGSIFAQPLLASNRQKQHLTVVSIQTTVNVVMNLLLIPRYGIVGSAWAMVGSETVSVILFAFMCAKLVRIPMLLHLRRVVVAGTAMGIVMVWLKGASVWQSLLAGLSSYVLLLILLQELKRSDLKSLYSLFGPGHQRTSS